MRLNGAVPDRTYYILLIICTVIFLALCIRIGFELYTTRDYQYTNGTITAVSRKVNMGINNDSNYSITHYVECTYTVDQTEYQCAFRTFFPFIKKTGSSQKIYYSRTDPSEIRDPFIFEADILACLLLLLFILFFIFAIHQRRKSI